MVDRPIIFSAPMICALLADRKTQTRRLAWRSAPAAVRFDDPSAGMTPGTPSPWQRVQPGTRLWVREAWRAGFGYDGAKIADMAHHARIWFDADGSHEGGSGLKGRPSIHMPRWASRLTLTVTGVRVQRLQEISEADAQAEGARAAYGEPFDPDSALTDRRRFHLLWNHIHGPGSWDANPEVVCLSFRCDRKNIDG